MTRTPRPFPVAFRLLATACALLMLASAGSFAAAEEAPTKQDVQDAREKVQQLADDREAKIDELRVIEVRLNEATFEVQRQEGLLEQTLVELATTRKRIRQNQAVYDELRLQLNERAAETFMDGPGSDLDLVLDATSLAELSDRLEFVDAVNASDATLAQDVANLGYALGLDEGRLAELRELRLTTLQEAERQEDQIAADLAAAQQLRAEIGANLEEALKYSKKTNRLYQEAQDPYSYSHSSVPMPSGWHGLFDACPVDHPRGFGDGFGAPRYVGGFHPHRGVDIVAPEGTSVRATFDGVATDSSNLYGGTSVKVQGTYGYTYNAHLTTIAKLGPVREGDVIGYVGSTGVAGGETPHNHFEFWPNVVPAEWIVSYYGYSVIDGAINPYPLLVDACG